MTKTAHKSQKKAEASSPTEGKVKRKFSRRVLHNRRRHKLNHRPHECVGLCLVFCFCVRLLPTRVISHIRRVAIKSGRCSSIFRQQTESLNRGLKHKKIYTVGLGSVNRMGGPVTNMFAQMIEKRMSDICQVLKVNATHAKRKTVKTEDFKLFLKNHS